MINRENFEKLSAYLRTLPPDYEDFDMYVFGNIDSPPGTACGSVGCALGHGFAAGIGDPSGCFTMGSGWTNYCREYFSETREVYSWCFGDDWAHFDNTPKGAAERIDYMLDHGVPEEAGDLDFFEFFLEDDGPAKIWTDKLVGYERGGSM